MTHRRYLAAGLALTWLALVVVLYYIYHKPFTPALAMRIAATSWQVFLGVGLVSLAGGLGARLLPGDDLLAVPRAVLQAVAGLGLMAIAVLILGAGLAWNPLFAWTGVLAVALLSFRPALRWWRAWRELPQLWDKDDQLVKTLAVCTGLIFGFTLVTALAPPLKWDALVYHLVLPKKYLLAGRVGYDPQIMYWGLPQLGEMLYAWAMALGGEQVPAVLGWAFGGLAVLGLVGGLAPALGLRAAWVGAAVLLSGLTLAASLAWAYVDWLAILFGVAFLLSMGRWHQDRSRLWLVWSAVFAGLALGAKLTAGVLLISGLVCLAWFQRRAGMRQVISTAAGFGLVAALVSSPWWIKNGLATGNPFYPFFFPSGAMDAIRQELYQGGDPWGGWQEVLLLPLRATVVGAEAAPGYGASIGPLLLGLGFVGVFVFIRSPNQRNALTAIALSVAIPSLVVWTVAGRFSSFLLQSRLYFAIFPALATLAAAGFAAFDGWRLPQLRIGRVAGFLVVLVLGLNTLEVGVQTVRQGALSAVFGLRSSEDYLAANLGWYAPAMQSVRDLPEGASVLMLWEPRSLHCLPRCEPDEVIDRWLHDLRVHGSPGAVLEAWQRDGFTHLLYYRLGADFVRREDRRYQPAEWQALDALLSQLQLLQDFGDAYTLYRLSP